VVVVEVFKNMRRTLYIIIGVVLLAIIVLLAFMFLRGGSTTPTSTTGTTGSLPGVGTQTGTGSGNNPPGGTVQPVSGIPTAAAGTLGITSNETASDYFVDAKNNVFLVEPDGKVGEVTNGQVNYLSSSAITGLISAGFSYDGTMAFVNFGDPNDPQSSIFNITTKAWTPLPVGLISPEWSPSDYRIAYLLSASTTETLFTLDVSKTNAKPTALLTLDTQDLDLQWLSKTQIVLFDKPSALTVGSAWLFDLQKNTLSPIVFEWPGFEAAWTGSLATGTAPMGLAFQSTPSALGGHLQLIGLSGNTIRGLNFLTLPSKCLFNEDPAQAASSTTGSTTSTVATAPAAPSLDLYCAVPTDQTSLGVARLPDVYDQMALFTADQIYRINTANGTTQTILGSQGPTLDVTDMKVFNNVLFFINRYDEKLYAISLSGE
jgi:hypothetical protein